MEVFVDFYLNLDAHLATFVDQYGPWVYALLFLILFAETGLVVTPFLPGDSLLFTTGAMAASGILNIWTAAAVMLTAAIVGDAVNYSIGHFISPRVFRAEDRTSFWHRLLNRNHLMKAHAFFERHGGKVIVLGPFVPIIRTFVPFVAGCGSMSYSQFPFYNVTGVVLWVGVCVGAGYGFGNVPAVKENFELVVVGIILVSMLPILWGYLLTRLERRKVAEVKRLFRRAVADN